MKRRKGGMRNYPKKKIWRDTPIEELREKVYFDISIDNKRAGRLVFVLYVDKVPRTVGNFSELVTHQHRYGYKGTAFFRIIPGFMCQGGDWLTNTGQNSNSVFSRPFLDENFKVKHDGPGILTMANCGPDTNGSQFLITFKATPWLDGKNVAFGKLEEGWDVLKKIEECGSKDGRPTKRVIISRCDEITSEYHGQMDYVFGKGDSAPRAVRRTSNRAMNAPTNMRTDDLNMKNLREAPKSKEDYILPDV